MSLEIPRGRGVLKFKILEAKYEAKMEFPGGGGGCKTENLSWGEYDIFWNSTLQTKHRAVDKTWEQCKNASESKPKQQMTVKAI